MKIKSNPAVKTVTATKTRTTVKKAAPKAAKSGEKSVTFTVHAEAGKSVYLAGSFNNWDPAGKKMLEKKRSRAKIKKGKRENKKREKNKRKNKMMTIK